MKYFGTDGIRGIVNKDLNKSLIKKVAVALVKYYNKFKLKKVLLVGNDSRISSDYILSEFACILLKNGIKIDNLGLCSSPCLAYVTKNFNYPLGLMISASHNPSEFNGLKFFNSKGEKVNDEFESLIELLMAQKSKLPNNEFVTLNDVKPLQNRYISYLKSLINFNFECLFDCSNGGASEICKQVFSKQEIINYKPNGLNINDNCGCTHLEMLRSLCITKQKIGFAFDGDADRVHIISETGEIVKGDKILYILSKFYQSKHNTLIGTIYTNSGLEQALKFKNITLIRANVGDKNVYNLMTKHNSILGGENSGHIILKPYTNTGDGLLNAIIIANLIQLSGLKLSELLKEYVEFHQLRENLSLTKEEMQSLNFEKIALDFTTEDIKVIIRPSGTEPVLRLFVESKNLNLAKQVLEKIKNLILQII